MVVHGLSANLDLERPTLFVAHHGVQRLVTVGFGLGDVVVKLFGHRQKTGVHMGQRGITGVDTVHHHPQRTDVEHTIKVKRLATHFFDDAVDVFGATRHLCFDAQLVEVLLQTQPDLFHMGFALDAFFIQHARHLFVGVGLQKAEGQVFHFPLDLPNAQAVGQGGKHMQRFGRNGATGVALDGSKVAQGLQAGCQPQHHHPHVAGKRQKHFAHVLGLGRRQFGHRLLAERGHMQRSLLGGLALFGLAVFYLAGLDARCALQLHQLGGFHGQGGKVLAKGFGDGFLRTVQVLAGVHQIRRRLHGL